MLAAGRTAAGHAPPPQPHRDVSLGVHGPAGLEQFFLPLLQSCPGIEWLYMTEGFQGLLAGDAHAAFQSMHSLKSLHIVMQCPSKGEYTRSDFHTLPAVLTHLTGLTKFYVHCAITAQHASHAGPGQGQLSDAIACLTGLQHLEINVPVDAAAQRAPLFSCLRKLTKMVVRSKCRFKSTPTMPALHGDGLLGASHLQSLQWLGVDIERGRVWDQSCVAKSFAAALPSLKQLRCLVLCPEMCAISLEDHLRPLAHTLTRLHIRTRSYLSAKRSTRRSEHRWYADCAALLGTVGVLTSLHHMDVVIFLLMAPAWLPG